MKLWFWIFGWFLCILTMVVNGYIAVVKPLKYLTLMKRRRVIQMVFTSWWIPFLFSLTFSLLSIRLSSFEHAMTIVGYLYLLFEKILCLMLTFFLTSMFLVMYNLNSRDRTVTRQLNFNHRIVKVQTQNKPAVKWVVLVTCVFLLCYGIFLRCSLLFLTGHKCGDDFYYKIILQVINSGINRKVYAFFKAHKERMRKASLQKASLFNNRVISTQEKH